MDDAGPQPVFVAVCCYDWKDPHRSILQLDTEEALEKEPSEEEEKNEIEIKPLEKEPSKEEPLEEVKNEKEIKPLKEEIKKEVIEVTIEKCVVARFNGQGEYISRFDWLFCPPTTSSTPVLYMVPNWDHTPESDDDISEDDDDISSEDNDIHKKSRPVQGYGFNLSTGQLLSINAPKASKSDGNVLNHTGCIYFMSNPSRLFSDSVRDFELYDPDKDEWNALPLFPHANEKTLFVGTAVLKDTILYNFINRKLWAYYLTKRKWYPVDVVDSRCSTIFGEAVVLGKTIYALTRQSTEIVLALSLKRWVGIDGDCSFRCSLLEAISVPGMDRNLFDEGDEGYCHDTRLVHLGKDNFCIVWSCILEGSDFQPVQVTYLKLKEEGGHKSMTVTNIRLYKLIMHKDRHFYIKACFSLPKSKTTALQKGAPPLAFDLEPFSPEFIASKHPKGHYIIVKKLPDLPFAYLRILMKEKLEQFGSIKRGGIKVRENEEGMYYAFVEFESADSKQNAVKASHVLIEGSMVEIAGEAEEPTYV